MRLDRTSAIGSLAARQLLAHRQLRKSGKNWVLADYLQRFSSLRVSVAGLGSDIGHFLFEKSMPDPRETSDHAANRAQRHIPVGSVDLRN